MATALKGTPYAAIIAVGLAEAIERGNLFKLELALDRRYFDGALAAAAKVEEGLMFKIRFENRILIKKASDAF